MTYSINGAVVDSGGIDDRLLPWARVQEIAGISRSTAWRMQQTGDFPVPVPVSAQRVGWWESELTAWKASRKSGRVNKPKSLTGTRPSTRDEAARQSRPVPFGALQSFPETPSMPARTERKLERQTSPMKAFRKIRARPAAPGQIDFGF